MTSGTLQDASNKNTLCYVDGEYIAYQNATLSGTNKYNLSYLLRGVYNTPISSHSLNSKFLRLDDAVFKYDFGQEYVGTTIYIKLQGFNIYGSGQQSLADASAYSYQIKGTALSSPLPDVNNLRSNYIANIAQISWDEVTDFRTVQYEIRKGNSWQGSQILTRVAHPPFATQGDGTYWIAAYSQPQAGIQVYSQNPQAVNISGSLIVSNVIATYDEAASGWTGILGGSAAAVTGGIVETSGIGNILTEPNFLGIPDLFAYGGEGNGTYEMPTSHQISIGIIATCNILIAWQSIGQKVADNILTVADFLNDSDILDWAASLNTNIYPEIALSQDGISWGSWQKYAAGSYSAMKFKARMQMQTFDPQTIAILQAFTFSIDVPD
ncbi:MAG: hypothetical protein WCL30_06370, partial [Pseudomonadota bacterium]